MGGLQTFVSLAATADGPGVIRASVERRFARGAVLATLLAILAGSCGWPGSGGSTSPAVDPSAAVGILDWRSCGDDQCSELAVPLDHRDPDAGLIELGLRRHRATGDRLGVLLVNPGGPGASGTALVGLVVDRSPDLAARYDIVGWDPRGVGTSSPLECEAPLLALYALDATPDDAAEQADLDARAAAATDACVRDNGALLAHVGTDAVADDVDAIRAALGEDRVSYLGFSYGTAIGLTYMQRHPDHVDRVALDGIFDPTGDLERWLTSQALALEAALDRILGEDAPAYAAASRAAEAGTISASPQALAHAALAATYLPERRSGFIAAVVEAANGDGDALAALGADYLSGAAFDAYTAVVCVDRDAPDGPAAFAAFADRLATAAPRLGGTVANELLPCATWPAPTRPPITTIDSPAEVLVIGNTGDAATPYAAAVQLAETLPNATLFTYDGEGHLSFLQGSACTDAVVVEYLISGALPAPGTVCD